MAPRNKIKVDRLSPDNSQFVGIADDYIKQQGYTDSSVEAAKRAAKANKYKYRPKVGNYRDPGDVK